MTTAVVIGTVIGSGIFLLPASLAPLGINAPLGWVISGLGAMCIAFALSRIILPDGGGLQSYIEHGLGPTAGFIATFAFWVSAWTAIAATGIAAAAALSRIVPEVSDPWSVAMVAISAIVVITIINLRGVRAAGGFAVISVAIRILPLLAVIAVVLVRRSGGETLAPLAKTPVTIDNLATAVTLTLFAIVGFEAGTTLVGKVRNPTRTIPLALMAGTAFCVMLYLFSSTAVTLILSPQATAGSLAPYADALKDNWGEGAALLAAAGIAVAAIGGLNSNLLCSGEVGFSMGLRGDLPRVLGRTNAANTPIASLLLAAALAIILVLANSNKSTAELFIFVSLLCTSVTLFVYLLGAIVAWRTQPSTLAKLPIIASILFTIFAFYGAGLAPDLWGVALLIAGLAIRWAMHRFSARAGSTPAAAEPAT
jgi:APA family basic amino acid/polyamine antiporter